MNTHVAASALAALFALSACAIEPSPDTDLPSEEEPVDPGKADALGADNWTYYTARPDYRLCVWPMCGGAFVKRVNQPKTKCADGGWRNECYVADFDWSKLGLSEAEAAEATSAARAGLVVMRGSLGKSKVNGTSISVFKATEGWRAATQQQPTGIFYRAKSSGIQCITFPCPVIEATRLNRNSNPTATYAGVDLAPSGATEGQIDAAWEELHDGSLIIAAKVEPVTGPAGTMNGLSASQFYTRIVTAQASKPCITTGCSGQICAGQDVMTTCEWKPEYACYQQYGKCELQPDGKCGWTPTAELSACLASP